MFVVLNKTRDVVMGHDAHPPPNLHDYKKVDHDAVDLTSDGHRASSIFFIDSWSDFCTTPQMKIM